ncbi:hypothetical protein AB0H43_02935 [Hamadaea sp. NPDC050747]|uniref:hypothetical protein n=1 Tax=Hamadaea sp. NPDC050747 TaxID=3155789 RepID=UPI00340C321F
MIVTREYRKCASCGEYRHDYMFPFADPAAWSFAHPPRSSSPKAVAAFAKRAADAVRIRKAAQSKGRNYSTCLPCVNGDA